MINLKIFFFLPFLFSQSVFAEQTIKIASYQIPGVIERDKSGFYDKVILKILKNTHKNYKYAVYPPARANSKFETKNADCLFPLDRRFYKSEGSSNFINSSPINTAKIYIYSPEGKGPYSTIEEIKGKRIGTKRGTPLGPRWESAKLNSIKVDTDEQNLKMLNAGRLDVFLAFIPDMNILKINKGIKLGNFNKLKPFDVHFDSLLCHKNKYTKKFVESFNIELMKLKSSGELKKMLGISYVD